MPKLEAIYKECITFDLRHNHIKLNLTVYSKFIEEVNNSGVY